MVVSKTLAQSIGSEDIPIPRDIIQRMTSLKCYIFWLKIFKMNLPMLSSCHWMYMSINSASLLRVPRGFYQSNREMQCDVV